MLLLYLDKAQHQKATLLVFLLLRSFTTLHDAPPQSVMLDWLTRRCGRWARPGSYSLLPFQPDGLFQSSFVFSSKGITAVGTAFGTCVATYIETSCHFEGG